MCIRDSLHGIGDARQVLVHHAAGAYVGVADLKAVIDYAKMPFIIKGIMTVAGAEKAVEAGARCV